MSQDKFDLEAALKNLNSAPSSQKKTGTIKKKNSVKMQMEIIITMIVHGHGIILQNIQQLSGRKKSKK